MPKYLIPRPKSVILDATGFGFVSFSIDNTNVRWIIDEVGVQTDQAQTATPVPVCLFRLADPLNGPFQGGTQSGNLDTATGRIILYAGDTVFAVWEGGVPGSKATATISGTFDPAGTAIEM